MSSTTSPAKAVEWLVEHDETWLPWLFVTAPTKSEARAAFKRAARIKSTRGCRVSRTSGAPAITPTLDQMLRSTGMPAALIEPGTCTYTGARERLLVAQERHRKAAPLYEVRYEFEFIDPRAFANK